MNGKKQLFTTYDISIPDTVIRTRNNVSIVNQKVKHFPFVHWPNGRPCEAINLYLLDCANGTTGNTLKAYASEVSHLVRYCSLKGIGFEALNDSHIFELSQQLQEERSINQPAERARNNNTVRTILRRIIHFLRWYQDHLLLPTTTPLIGEKQQSPRITVQCKKNPHTFDARGSYYFTHRAMPTTVSREPKRPIAQSIIEDVEMMIDTLTDLDAQSDKTLHRYRNNMAGYKAQLEYVRARRHFMIWLMKRTGLRPSEMIEIPLKENANILQTKCIITPTKKRRKSVAPTRRFPITLKDATTFKRYLTSRQKYIQQLCQQDPLYDINDALFLGINGEAIRKTSLEKDFERLIKACNHDDVQACFSMFRHRFITFEVIVHLKEFISASGKTRQIMSDADYQSILKRVATKTGHGSEQSLWHYIDLAWEEMDVWCNIDRASDRLHAVDRLYEDLLNLRYELKTDTPLSAVQVVDRVVERLSLILHRAKEHLTDEVMSES